MKNIKGVIENYVGNFVEDSAWNLVNRTIRKSVWYPVNDSFGVPVSNFRNGPTNQQITTDLIDTVTEVIYKLYKS